MTWAKKQSKNLLVNETIRWCSRGSRSNRASYPWIPTSLCTKWTGGSRCNYTRTKEVNSHVGFAILIADLIRHVANSYNVDRYEVLCHIVQELAEPGDVESFGSPQ